MIYNNTQKNALIQDILKTTKIELRMFFYLYGKLMLNNYSQHRFNIMAI